jgi:type IV pilus assembly protein PilW
MRATNAIPMRNQRGFSLIELMVGVVIGLLTVLVITQVMTLAEGKRRTISMGSDAQINAALAMFTVQRDIEQSGYGVTANPAALGCPVKYQYGTSGTAASFTLVPTLITPGASATVPDSVTVLQANTTGFSAPMLLTGSHSATDNHFSVSSSLGAAVGNQMIAAPAVWDATHWCTLFSVTSNTASADTTLSNGNVPHVVASTGPAQWNQNSLLPAAGYATGSYLVNLGAMVLRTYSVSAAGNLQTTELSATDGSSNTQDLYPQIVNLKALYGKDTGTDGVVDTYESAAPTTNADWSKVLSVRIALVARSGQYEKELVTSAAPQWDLGAAAAVPGGATCNGTHKCLTLGVSQVGTDWQHYRYKVYETIVPLRNVLWNN